MGAISDAPFQVVLCRTENWSVRVRPTGGAESAESVRCSGCHAVASVGASSGWESRTRFTGPRCIP
ncbi:hypothetical protein D7D52_16890 [Nocardia yunnanensis]|uniref:Uncharacterized protein n=1 Tax=Nocardia yunnanensis TaxID=2382165 RepID=A0A386ZD51_9NOCA|nr:hypothetical protein D7D52_16890 [Nocardia yunnanensis]